MFRNFMLDLHVLAWKNFHKWVKDLLICPIFTAINSNNIQNLRKTLQRKAFFYCYLRLRQLLCSLPINCRTLKIILIILMGYFNLYKFRTKFVLSYSIWSTVTWGIVCQCLVRGSTLEAPFFDNYINDV